MTSLVNFYSLANNVWPIGIYMLSAVLFSTQCHTVYTVQCWAKFGAAVCSVAPLWQIMTSLLKMTSLTSDTVSKTASSSPSRHLSLIWRSAHTTLLTSVLCLSLLHPVVSAIELTWVVILCAATREEVVVIRRGHRLVNIWSQVWFGYM